MSSFLINIMIIMIEEYLNGGRPDQLNDIRSASKSILSAILGCAIKDGYIDSIDQKVIDFFPEYKSEKLDPNINKLKIKHLITMKSGFKIKETAKVYQQLYNSPDWVEHILQLQFNKEPGERFKSNHMMCSRNWVWLEVWVDAGEAAGRVGPI